MSEEYSEPLTELLILRKAYRLLVDIESLPEDDKRLIATQVRRVLRTGERFPSPKDTPAPSCGDIPDPEANDDADVYLSPQAIAALDPPPFPGFTVAERADMLGYRLDQEQRAFLTNRLQFEVRAEWIGRFGDLPAQHQGEDWYATEDSPLVDGQVHAYLAKFPHLISRAPGWQP